MNIEYNGRPDFSRPRKLSEIESIDYFNDNLYGGFTGQNEKDAYTDKLFTDLARVYLKGEVLKEGLSKMNPAQFIPIDDSADAVRAAATRIAAEESQIGKIITYSMYQTCVDTTLDRKWEMRGAILSGQIPASTYEDVTQTNKAQSGGYDKFGTLIKEFVQQNGMIATLLSVYTSSMFMADIFQGMSVENAAKGIQASKWPLGIVVFLELGIKAERIYNMLKAAKINVPNIQEIADQLENSPEARAEALASFGMDYNDFKKSQSFRDSEVIVRYVSDYFNRYGGLDRPNGQLTLDHWIAYGQVAQNQQLLRGGLNMSTTFSPKFISYKNQFDPPLQEPSSNQQGLFAGTGSRLDKRALILNELASMVQTSSSMSDRLYDDILSVFSKVDSILSDDLLCCVVQIFGALADPDLLRAVASALLLVAAGFGAELSRAFNAVLRLLSTLLVDAIFELIASLNQFYHKILSKLAEIFTIRISDYPACQIVLSIGWAILASIDALFKQIMTLLKELANYISAWGTFNNFRWEVTADRRLLFGLGKMLMMLANKIEIANACAMPNRNRVVEVGEFDSPETTVDEAIFSILGTREPSLQISTENLNKHFPNITLRESKNLKFKYGISSLQNNETANKPRCEDPNQREKLEELIKNITTAVQQSFNG